MTNRSWRFWLVTAAAAALQAVLLTTSLYETQTRAAAALWNLPLVAGSLLLFALLLAACAALPAAATTDPRRPAVALAGIVVLALVLRVYAIDRMPPGFFQDEAINGNDALALGDFYRWQFWSESISGRPTLFLYLLLLPLRLFGNTYLALKLLPVALGVATVIATFLFARLLFGVRVGLWAALLLACSRWHIHYSRMAWEAICVPLFATIGFACLIRALRSTCHRVRWSAAAGATLAFGLYTYAGYRAVPVAALLYLIVVAIAEPKLLWQRRGALAVGAGLFALISTPLMQFAWQNPEFFWERYREVALAESSGGETLRAALHQLGKTLLSFNHRGDALVRHNLPNAPQLDPLSAGFLLIGGALALRRLRSPQVQLLAVWLLAFVALSSVTTEAPHATRLLGALPAVAILAALGASAWWSGFRQSIPLAGLQRFSLVAILIALVGLNAEAYFVRHAANRHMDIGFNTLARDLCEYARDQPGTTFFWTDDIDYWASAQCKFLARETHFALFPLTTAQLLIGPPQHPPPLIVLVGMTAIRNSKAQPEGRIVLGADGIPDLPFPVTPEVVRDRFGNLLYFRYRIN